MSKSEQAFLIILNTTAGIINISLADSIPVKWLSTLVLISGAFSIGVVVSIFFWYMAKDESMDASEAKKID